MFEHVQENPSSFARWLRSRQFKILATVSVIWALILGFAFCFWATPYYAIWRMKSAAQERDAATFCSYIDFPRLRESLKAELNAKLLFDMKNDAKLKNNPFSGLAALAGPAMINNMIDGYVTPSAIERSFAEDAKSKDQNVATETFNKDFLAREGQFVGSAYQSFGEFHLILTDQEQKETRLIFERRTLFWWQLVGMKLD